MAADLSYQNDPRWGSFTDEEQSAYNKERLKQDYNPTLTEDQLKAMVPLKSLRGRPKSDNPKLLISIRYSPEVITYFRNTGEGWQARMVGVLQDYVAKQNSRRSRPIS